MPEETRKTRKLRFNLYGEEIEVEVRDRPRKQQPKLARKADVKVQPARPKTD